MHSESEVHIAAIKKALQNRTAAVMVGAGFSRNAEGGENLKLWKELARELWNDLNPSDLNSNEIRETSVIQLASQYAQLFSLPALEQLLKKHIPDEKVRPGELHKSLLKLPWSEIFTTNYDTLLERAAEDIFERSYFTVTCREDIPRSKSLNITRIVKLHGSFPSQRPFIFTEEQYRSYPEKFAPFINLVRQSMLENSFCLVGFSGDDPNFLQWIGWVRDMLDQHALPIYLFTANPISFAQYKLLESRKVTPVVLPTRKNGDPLDYQDRYKYLIEEISASSEVEKEKEWTNTLEITLGKKLPKQEKFDIDSAAKQVRKIIDFKKEYPGWIIAPFAVRRELQQKLSSLQNLFSDQSYTDLSEQSPHTCLVSISLYAWLTDRTLLSINDKTAKLAINLLEQTLGRQNYPKESNSLLAKCGVENYNEFLNHWNELASQLAKWSREEQDKDSFEKVASLVKNGASRYKTLEDKLNYEASLFAIYSGDLSLARRLIFEWSPASNDTYMEVRKGALLAEIGEISLGLKTSIQGLQKIRRNLKANPENIKFLSEESWAYFVIARMEQVYSYDLKTKHRQKNLFKSPSAIESDKENLENLTPIESHSEQQNRTLPDSYFQSPKEADEPDTLDQLPRIEPLGKAKSEINPEKEVETILSLLDSEVSHRSKEAIATHQFALGAYRAPSSANELYATTSYEHKRKTESAYSYINLVDNIALPPKMGGFGWHKESFIQAGWWISQRNLYLRVFSIALRTADSDILKPSDHTEAPYKTGWLSRYDVATAHEDIAEQICDKAIHVMESSLTEISKEENTDKHTNKIKRDTILFLAESYSRFILRISNPAKLDSYLKEIISLHQSQDLWIKPELWGCFSNALHRSLEAMAPNVRQRYLADILSLPPLPPRELEDKFSHHYRHNWIDDNKVLNTFKYSEVLNTPAIENEVERLITQLYNTNSEDIKEKIWIRIFALDELKLVADHLKARLSEMIWQVDNWPIIPGFKKFACLTFPPKDFNPVKRLHTQKIGNLSYISKGEETEKVMWSYDESDSLIYCWIYANEKLSLDNIDIACAIKAMQRWHSEEWDLIINSRPLTRSQKNTISKRLNLFDKLLTLMLPQNWQSIEEIASYSKWIKGLPAEADKCGIEFRLFYLREHLSKKRYNRDDTVENDVANALLDETASQSFTDAISTVRDIIKIDWNHEPEKIVDTIIFMIASGKPLITTWGLDLLILIIKKHPESLSIRRFSRIETPLIKISEKYAYRPFFTPKPLYLEEAPIIRHKCALLCTLLYEKSIYANSKAVKIWLDEIKKDPLPEVRYIDSYEKFVSD